MNIPENVLEFIKREAADDLLSEDEDFCPMDWSGGNFDDAFSLGIDEGYRLMAREILKMIGKDNG